MIGRHNIAATTWENEMSECESVEFFKKYKRCSVIGGEH